MSRNFSVGDLENDISVNVDTRSQSERIALGFAVTLRKGNLRFSAEFPWKISIVSFMAFPGMMQEKGDIAGDLLKILGDTFFDAVEVPSISSADWERVKGYVAERTFARGLQPDILTNKLDLNSLDGTKRREAISRIKNEIDLASSRGIRMIGICSGPDPGVERRREAAESLFQSLMEICEHAAEKQVRVALETFDRDYDKRLLIGPLSEAIEAVGKVRKRFDNIGLMWDLSHAPMLKETPEDLKRVAGLLAHIHVGCSKKTDGSFLDTHPGFYTKGAVNSESDVARLLQVLLEIGYDGMVGFEVKPEPQQTSEEIVSTAKGVLMSAYQSVASSFLKTKYTERNRSGRLS